MFVGNVEYVYSHALCICLGMWVFVLQAPANDIGRLCGISVFMFFMYLS